MIARLVRFSAASVVLISLITATALAQEATITPLKSGGVYAVGEKVGWKIQFKGPDAPTQADFVLKKGGFTEMKRGTIELTAGAGMLETSLDEPGTILAEIKAKIGGKDVKTLAGAAIAPEKITPSAPRPDDFDAFWKVKVDQLSAIPANPVVEPVDSAKPNVEYFKVTLDNINGSHVYGQLAKPKREGKFPAILLVQYAGVYGLPPGNVISKAEGGWLALNIMAHDLPFDRPADFYTKASATTLKNYMTEGNDDREKNYYLRMYLGCYRAADYLAHRPDWDGRTLVVMGTSQGGLQAVMTAGFYPGITAMIANVPAGADTTGPLVGRAGGHPYWYGNAKGKPNEKQIMETSRYFDVVNFASHIKCPSLVALGLIDETCPPSGVFAAYNQIQAPKEVVVMVNSDHKGKNNSQAEMQSRSAAWLKAIMKGDPVPPAKPAK